MKTTPNDLMHSFNHTDYTEGNFNGLTKREYFAAMAMQGLCVQIIAGSHNRDIESFNREKAAHAVNLADELINALNK
jgi:hypothetical protein